MHALVSTHFDAHTRLTPQVLGKLDWYAALTAVERRKLADAVIEETHEEGEAVVREGEPANAMYIIKEGTVSITKQSTDAAKSGVQVPTGDSAGTVSGRSTPSPLLKMASAPDKLASMAPSAKRLFGSATTLHLADLEAGAVFGEGAMVGSGRRNATITATSRLVLLRLDQETCVNLLGSIKDTFSREAARREVANQRRLSDVCSPGLSRSKSDGAPPGLSRSKSDGAPGPVHMHLNLGDEADGRLGGSMPESPPVIVKDEVTGNITTPRGTVVASRPGMNGLERLRVIVTSTWFATIANGLVAINVLLMCLAYEGMPSTMANLLDQAIRLITYIFIAEMALKLLAVGCGAYWSDFWNRQDGIIVTVSIAEIVSEILDNDGSMQQLSFLRVLRLQRVLRMLRLLRSFNSLYRLVACFGRSLAQMLNLLILLLLFMVVAALIGMQVFGGVYDEAAGFSLAPCPATCANASLEPKPRLHFDYFVPSMLTVFTLVTGEWFDAMVDSAAAVGVSSSLYYVLVVLFGRYLIMNLLIAVVLHAFSTDDDDDDATSQKRLLDQVAKPTPLLQTRTRRHIRMPLSSDEPLQWPQDYSLCLFPRGGAIRTACCILVEAPLFSRLFHLFVLGSCVALAAESPRQKQLDPTTSLPTFLDALDVYVWPWLFAGALTFMCMHVRWSTRQIHERQMTSRCMNSMLLRMHLPMASAGELLLKAIAYGFVFGPGAYLQSW